MPQTQVYITVDTNDGDCVSTMSPLKDPSHLPLLEKLGELMVKEGGRWPGMYDDTETPEERFKDTFTEKEIDILSWNYFPVFEGGFHTICEIKILTIAEERNIL